MTAGFGDPEPIRQDHELAGFACGNEALDRWLRDRALDNERRGATRTFVVTAGGRVVGYYSLAVSALHRREATGRARRNMPEPIPAMLLARLAPHALLQRKSQHRVDLANRAGDSGRPFLPPPVRSWE